MNSMGRRRSQITAASAAGLLILVGACSTDTDGGSEGENTAAAIDCSQFEQYGDLEGKTISVYTSIVDPEAEEQRASYAPFEECTGAEIEYEGSREFEAQLPVRLTAGNPPDIAYIPQPGFLKSLVEDFPDVVVPAGESVVSNANEFYTPEWVDYGTVDGKLYATPLGANVKSFVWYSPSAFEGAGYEVPTTLDELMDLSQQIADDGAIPWCAGSSPVRRLAGRPPTGSRTWCSAPPAPRSTTSGSTTRSRSTTRRSSRPSGLWGTSSRTTRSSTAAWAA